MGNDGTFSIYALSSLQPHADTHSLIFLRWNTLARNLRLCAFVCHSMCIDDLSFLLKLYWSTRTTYHCMDVCLCVSAKCNKIYFRKVNGFRSTVMLRSSCRHICIRYLFTYVNESMCGCVRNMQASYLVIGQWTLNTNNEIYYKCKWKCVSPF